MNKKAYFFTIDGLIAIGVLILGFAFLIVTFIASPPETQAEFFSSDLINLFDNTYINDLNQIQFSEIFNLDINQNNTLIEQMALYCYLGREADATTIAASITTDGDLIRKNYDFEIILKGKNKDNDDIECNAYSRGDIDLDNPNLIITAKDIVYFKINESHLSSPYIAEVNVWN